MARGKLDINVRLERQEKKILKLTAELEAAKDEYEKLLQEQKETPGFPILETPALAMFVYLPRP